MTQYLVIELQATGTDVANIVTAYNDLPTAESNYHRILSAAATSAVPKHSALLMTDDCVILRSETYKHGTV